MTDPLLHDARVEYVVATIAKHDLDGDLTCTCGWQPPEHHCDGHDLSEQCAGADVFAWERHRADALLAALDDAGVLIPAGAETRIEWAVEMTAHGAPEGVPLDMAGEYGYRTTPIHSEAIARGVATEAKRHSPPVRVVSRTVHIGPWQPADTEETQP